MMNESGTAVSAEQRNAFAALRNLVRDRAPRELCDVCGRDIPHQHAHLFEPTRRQVICVCEQCAVGVGEGANSAYRRVPRRVRCLDDFVLSDAQWDDLMIPVGMAFFFYNTPVERVLAFYPGAAGVTESLLDLAAWREVVQENPILSTLEADVEALLVNRTGSSREYFLVPIDKCYELSGLIRLHWRGLSGGAKVWGEISSYFTDLKTRSVPAEEAHARTEL